MRQHVSDNVRFGLLGAYPGSSSGLARFSAGLADAFGVNGAEVSVVRVADGSESRGDLVVGELVNGSALSVAACTEVLNRNDVAVIQHQFDLYGGTHGDELIEIVEGLRVPSVLIAHSVLKSPEPHQRWVFERIVSTVDRVVVMSECARERLCGDYAIERRKVVTIPHGGIIPTAPRLKRPSRPTILTWGLLRPGKGIERVIEAMAGVHDAPGRPRYLVVGQTDPKELAASGEAYRNGLIEQAARSGVSDSVSFDPRYYGDPMLTALVQSASVIVLPYDSTDQVTSSALVTAITSGRPIIATAFPHAVEVLCGGAGIVVGHDDADALASGLRRVLTQPRLAGSLAAEARQLAPTMAWPVVADAYVHLAQRILADRRARR